MVSEKNPTESLLDKGFKTTISKINKTLKMLRELKDVEKVKKTMHEQNGNINKETENKKEPKRNSGAIKKITEMKNSL